MLSKATFIVDLNMPQLREVFAMEAAERDTFISSRFLSLDFFNWPATRMAVFCSNLDRFNDEISVTNKQLIIPELGPGLTALPFLSATVWMKVADYFDAKTAFLNMMPEEADVWTAFDRAASSFHLPARIQILEDGREVCAQETENNFVLESHVLAQGQDIKADLSDCSSAPEEGEYADRFNQWFAQRSQPAMGYTSVPSIPACNR